MDAQTLFEGGHLAVDLIIGGVGAYIGLKVGLVKLQIHMDTVRTEVQTLGHRSLRHNDDLIIHDIEIGTVMDHLSMKRQRRQTVKL